MIEAMTNKGGREGGEIACHLFWMAMWDVNGWKKEGGVTWPFVTPHLFPPNYESNKKESQETFY